MPRQCRGIAVIRFYQDYTTAHPSFPTTPPQTDQHTLEPNPSRGTVRVELRIGVSYYDNTLFANLRSMKYTRGCVGKALHEAFDQHMGPLTLTYSSPCPTIADGPITHNSNPSGRNLRAITEK